MVIQIIKGGVMNRVDLMHDIVITVDRNNITKERLIEAVMSHSSSSKDDVAEVFNVLIKHGEIFIDRDQFVRVQPDIKSTMTATIGEFREYGEIGAKVAAVFNVMADSIRLSSEAKERIVDNTSDMFSMQ